MTLRSVERRLFNYLERLYTPGFIYSSLSLSSFKCHLNTFLFSFYRLAHAARTLGFFYKNALYKFTVIIIIIFAIGVKILRAKNKS